LAGILNRGFIVAITIPERVREAMRWAWERSQADNPELRHEEGGYIVVEADGTLGVRWWRPGNRSSIVPPHRAADRSFAGRRVVGEFHIHPNPPEDELGRTWSQEPSPIDIAGIVQEKYSDVSYIITEKYVWQIEPNGRVRRAGARTKLLTASARAKGEER
jgi:hypothetical protein